MDIDVHNLSVIVSTNIYLKKKKKKKKKKKTTTPCSEQGRVYFFDKERLIRVINLSECTCTTCIIALQ